MKWEVKIEGAPNSQMRHRHRKLKDGRVITYDPSKKDKKVIEEIIDWQKPKELFTGPVFVKIIAWFPIPKSYSAKKAMALEDAYRPKKPDNDNIEKFYYDCMSGIVFEDDNQVVVNVTHKRQSANPRVYITVGDIDEITDGLRRFKQ